MLVRCCNPYTSDTGTLGTRQGFSDREHGYCYSGSLMCGWADRRKETILDDIKSYDSKRWRDVRDTVGRMY